MAFEVIGIDGDTVQIVLSGVMRLSDQQSLQVAGKQLIEEGAKLRLLIALDSFQGWEKGVDWGDIAFLMDYGNEITKMAVVGEERWKEPMYAFLGKGFRATEIEFFTPAMRRQAEQWVRQ